MATTESGVSQLFDDARWELLPFSSFDDQLDHVPNDATISITASPEKGIEPTVDLAVETAESTDYTVVPHVAARAVADRDQLADFATRFQEAGITDLFVPGGDNEEPVGEFSSSFELLSALEELGFDFDDIGITAYPEGHPKISDTELRSALEKKQPYATYAVTQICYDSDTVLAWLSDARDRGLDLPVIVGIPGVMNYQKLSGISAKVGVGESIRFVRKTSGIIPTIKRMLWSRGVYYPDDLVDGLAPYADDEQYDIAGLHLYTFNRANDTVAWRNRRLE